MTIRLLISLLFLALNLSADPFVRAADFRLEENVLTMTGEIVRGDSQALHRLREKLNGPVDLILNSPGGDVDEALDERKTWQLRASAFPS